MVASSPQHRSIVLAKRGRHVLSTPMGRTPRFSSRLMRQPIMKAWYVAHGTSPFNTHATNFATEKRKISSTCLYPESQCFRDNK